jgi:hypothetical protein
LHARKILVGFLLAGLIAAALSDSRRSAYFRSAAPWITVIAGFAVLGSHLVWLYQHDFVPFEYAIAKHGTSSFAGAAVKAFAYLAGSAAYARRRWSSCWRWRGLIGQRSPT